MLELLFGKRAKSADDLPLSSSASIPPLLTHFSHHSLLFSHTLDLVHSTDVIFLGEVLGCKRKQEIYAPLKAFYPRSPMTASLDAPRTSFHILDCVPSSKINFHST